LKEDCINYPLLAEWSISEIIAVTDFYQAVERLFTGKIARKDFLEKQAVFFKIVPAKAVRKQLARQFEKQTDCSIYQAVKFAAANQNRILHFRN
jgi:uncharacterized protein YktA (UPF0223 family)